MKGWGQCPSVGPQGVRCGLPKAISVSTPTGLCADPGQMLPMKNAKMVPCGASSLYENRGTLHAPRQHQP